MTGSGNPRIAYRNAVTTELIAAAVGLGLVGVLVYLVRRSLNERVQAAALVHEQRERLHTTLTSIGDAVIVTDAEGRVTLMNRVAQALTGWKDEALGRPLTEVFRIVNEQTRQPVESPVTKVIREGVVVGLANHTVLIRKGRHRSPDRRQWRSDPQRRGRNHRRRPGIPGRYRTAAPGAVAA